MPDRAVVLWLRYDDAATELTSLRGDCAPLIEDPDLRAMGVVAVVVAA